MYRERIRATRLWKKGEIEGPRYDCVLINNESESTAALTGFAGLSVARLRLLFSFNHDGTRYPCALVEWFSVVGNSPNSVTGYWVLKPEVRHGKPSRSVIHLDCILRGAHLMPVFGEGFVARQLNYTMTLDIFQEFYLNHHIDPHAFEVLR
jgi:hypothetical protein